MTTTIKLNEKSLASTGLGKTIFDYLPGERTIPVGEIMEQRPDSRWEALMEADRDAAAFPLYNQLMAWWPIDVHTKQDGVLGLMDCGPHGYHLGRGRTITHPLGTVQGKSYLKNETELVSHYGQTFVDQGTLFDGHTGFTFMIPIRPNHDVSDSVTNERLFLFRSNGSPMIELNYHRVGRMRTFTRIRPTNSVTNRLTPEGIFTIGQWSIITVVADGQSGRLAVWIDAEKVYDEEAGNYSTTTLATNNIELFLGGLSTTSAPVDISDTLLFRGALSDADLATAREFIINRNPFLQ